MKLFRTSRLKIVEQIIIVLLFSVIVPMLISWLIINNLNQQGVRRQLQNTAIVSATAIESSLEAFTHSNITKIEEIAIGFKFIKQKQDRYIYLNDIMLNNPNYKNLRIVTPKDKDFLTATKEKMHYDSKKRIIIIAEKIYDGSYIIANIDVSSFENDLFKVLKEDNREAYIVNNKNEIIFSHNFNKENFAQIKKMLPQKIVEMKPVVFGNSKNQPLVYFKLKTPDIMIIVDTTEKITNDTINESRNKIFVAFLATGFAIIFIVGLYTSYLYVNFRQLMKGIIAISRGSYARKIRLLTNIFTPYEIVFFASEFNKMSDEIFKSYQQLQQKNTDLKRLDKFRSNLIDTVSHEFRTPLTSIKGYTSRLLRTDIEIDEKMKVKSLKVIKRQVERLSAMVEDLLVVPDIEDARVNLLSEEVDVQDIIDASVLSVSKYPEKTFDVNYPENISSVCADRNRLEQICLNIFENAAKYSYEDTPVQIDVTEDEYFVKISTKNEADYIPKENLGKLFEKFARGDSEQTKNTSGTGLGLFIVRGLAESMKGTVELDSTAENLFVVTISIPKFNH